MTTDLTDAQARAMNAARQLILLVTDEELCALLDEYSRMDAVMPIVDPTAYRDLMDRIPRYRRVVAALARARGEIAAVLDEEIPGAAWAWGQIAAGAREEGT